MKHPIQRNTGLVMFYATSFMKDDFYYLQKFDAAVFAQYDGSLLCKNDIFCPNSVSVGEVISAKIALPHMQ